MMDCIFGRKRCSFFTLLYLLTIIFIFFVNIGYLDAQDVSGSSNSTVQDRNNDLQEQETETSFGPIPSNISVHVEPKDTGTLYLSALISDGNIKLTRDLNDEIFPFQTTNWYQLVTLTPNYTEISESASLRFNSLIVGQLQDFDNFDELLDQARIYSDVPANKTFILDLPSKDVSFMQLQVPFSNGTSGIYYGLYDGNQQGDKSEINLRLNPQSTLKILEYESAINIKSNEQLYNVTNTLVCNDIYKLGYEKCK
jgi:hypothetical protein